MTVEGGAAAYVFDFGGRLGRDATCKITAGMSAVEIHLPAGTAAKVVMETVLGSVDLSDGFMKKEGAFWNEAALRGGTPVLTVTASVVMGSIRLVTTPNIPSAGGEPASEVQVSKVTAEVVRP